MAFLILSVHAETQAKQVELTFQKVISLKQLHPILLHAKEHSQFVLIDFNEKNCAACIDLKSKTFSDTKIQEALKNYRLVDVHLTGHNAQSFEKRFNVTSEPTLVFIDKGGQFLPEFTTTGFVTSQQLLSLIVRVEKGNELSLIHI